MDHEVAAKTHAIERYLLGEMPTSERDAFEEHYFSCAECAGEIRSASAMMQDMKTALRDDRAAPPASSTGWFSWPRLPVLVPAFAAALLAVVVGYQNMVVLPELEAPRSMASALILDGATRGSAPAVRAGDPLQFLIALEAAPAGQVFAELDSASGRRVRAGRIAAPPPNHALDVFFPGKLSAGKYLLVIRENDGGRELAQSAFEVVDR